jgi:hypothetical protein
LPRLAAIISTASVASITTFRDMKGIVEAPSINAGTSTAVILNRFRLHLNAVILRLHGNREDSSGE